MNGADMPLSGYIEFGGNRALHDLQQVAGSTSASEGDKQLPSPGAWLYLRPRRASDFGR